MTTNKPAKYNPLISLARQAKRRNMDMQCDPQWVLDLADECEKLRKDAERYRHLRDRLTAPTFDNLFFLELYSAGAFDHPDDVDEAVDDAMQEDA